MSITAATQLFAVIGDPVGHSLSPVMHNGWFADRGIDAVYVALPLRSDDAAAAIAGLGQFGVRGLNVTVPHKEAAARAANFQGQAANTLRWEKNGALSAFNTDGAGFLCALDESAPGWKGRVSHALVIGAGGAAQAIGAALAPHVDGVGFINRTPARAEAVAATLPNGRVLRWEDMERGFGAADLIVQATTLGMAGQAAGPDWPVSACRAGAIIADIVYRPLETPLLKAAAARNLAVMDGLGMLIHQGALAFELWFGVRPDTSKARARLLEALGR